MTNSIRKMVDYRRKNAVWEVLRCGASAREQIEGFGMWLLGLRDAEAITTEKIITTEEMLEELAKLKAELHYD